MENLKQNNKYTIKASRDGERVFFIITDDFDGQAKTDFRLYERTGRAGYLRGVLEELAILNQQRLYSLIEVYVGHRKIGELTSKQQPRITRN